MREHRILSITADNGTEFSRLAEVFPQEYIYYAHTYSSWERGTNENHNRLTRRRVPQGTTTTTPQEVAFIENSINNYPKKCLDYKSPSEFLMGGLFQLEIWGKSDTMEQEVSKEEKKCIDYSF